jgi:hypothetical protein
MGFTLAATLAVFVAGAPPQEPGTWSPVEGGILGAAVGSLAGGMLLGAGSFATFVVINENECRGGCTDSQATAFLIATPYAAAGGLVIGALVGTLVGIGLASDQLAVSEHCQSAVGGICPGSRWCL